MPPRHTMRPFVGILFVVGCVRSAPPPSSHHAMAESPADPKAYGAEVERGYAQARGATAAYRVLDSAVARGYAASVPQCFADSTHGAMGYHHLNRTYVDNRIEIDK